MIIFLTTKAFLKPQSIELCKVYNVPGLHLASQWNNFKKRFMKLTTTSYIVKYIFKGLYFFNFSLYENCNFHSIVIANGLF